MAKILEEVSSKVKGRVIKLTHPCSSSFLQQLSLLLAETEEAKILEELSPKIKGRVVKHLLADVFASSHLFSRLDEMACVQLGAVMKVTLFDVDKCKDRGAAWPACLWLSQQQSLNLKTAANGIDGCGHYSQHSLFLP